MSLVFKFNLSLSITILLFEKGSKTKELSDNCSWYLSIIFFIGLILNVRLFGIAHSLVIINIIISFSYIKSTFYSSFFDYFDTESILRCLSKPYLSVNVF